MKTELKIADNKKIVSANLFRSYKFGTLGRIFSGAGVYEGHLVMRSYGGMISLTDPELYWNVLENSALQIEIFPPGTQIILTQE